VPNVKIVNFLSALFSTTQFLKCNFWVFKKDITFKSSTFFIKYVCMKFFSLNWPNLSSSFRRRMRSSSLRIFKTWNTLYKKILWLQKELKKRKKRIVYYRLRWKVFDFSREIRLFAETMSRWISRQKLNFLPWFVYYFIFNHLSKSHRTFNKSFSW